MSLYNETVTSCQGGKLEVMQSRAKHDSQAGGAARAGRRNPEEAELEILDAAEGFLSERPFRELTVGALMERTSIGRSAFYVYFRDRYDLIKRLLTRLEQDLFRASLPWLEGAGNSALDVRNALEAVVQVWVRHGPVLRAIAEAATQDKEVEEAYRWGLIQKFIEAIARRLQQETAEGKVSGIDPADTAAALIFLNERFLQERMGGPRQDDPERVVRTLYHIWTRTLYGTPPESVQ
jgi:AcrR family transcriptional regulator